LQRASPIIPEVEQMEATIIVNSSKKKKELTIEEQEQAQEVEEEESPFQSNYLTTTFAAILFIPCLCIFLLLYNICY
jgi:hypothetical protein